MGKYEGNLNFPKIKKFGLMALEYKAYVKGKYLNQNFPKKALEN